MYCNAHCISTVLKLVRLEPPYSCDIWMRATGTRLLNGDLSEIHARSSAIAWELACLCLRCESLVFRSLYLSVCLSLYVSLSLSISFCLSLSLFTSLCLSLSLSPPLSVSLYLSLSPSISIYLSIYLCLSLPLSVTLCLSLSLPASLCLSLSLCLSSHCAVHHLYHSCAIGV